MAESEKANIVQNPEYALEVVALSERKGRPQNTIFTICFGCCNQRSPTILGVLVDRICLYFSDIAFIMDAISEKVAVS